MLAFPAAASCLPLVAAPQFVGSGTLGVQIGRRERMGWV